MSPERPRRSAAVSTGPADKVWRVFTVRSRAEKRVLEHLQARGIEAYVPLRTALHQWSDRKRKVEVPLFPGYVFAKVDERQRLAVLEDAAVVRTVAFGARLAVVPDHEMELVRSLATLPGAVEAVTRRALPIGADVLLTNGPLKGVRGRVTGLPKERYLTVEVSSIHQAIRIQVPSDWAMRPPGPTSA